MSSGEGEVKPWTSRRFNTRPHREKSQRWQSGTDSAQWEEIREPGQNPQSGPHWKHADSSQWQLRLGNRTCNFFPTFQYFSKTFKSLNSSLCVCTPISFMKCPAHEDETSVKLEADQLGFLALTGARWEVGDDHNAFPKANQWGGKTSGDVGCSSFNELLTLQPWPLFTSRQ